MTLPTYIVTQSSPVSDVADATVLASTAGAATVGISDAGGFYSSTTVEGALQEAAAGVTPALKLDQTTPQTVSNGQPVFSQGLCIGNANTYFRLNGTQVQLWVNSVLCQSWPTTGTTGQSMGMLASITYPA
jgi:hypothetical protein